MRLDLNIICTKFGEDWTFVACEFFFLHLFRKSNMAEIDVIELEIVLIQRIQRYLTFENQAYS